MQRKNTSFLALVTVGIALFGLVMISSVSVFESNNLTFEMEAKNILRDNFAKGESDFESTKQIERLSLNSAKNNLTDEELKKASELSRNDFYFWRHLMHLAIAIVVFIVCARTPYEFWRKASLPLYAGSIILLLLLFSSFGNEYGTARSWLNIGFLPSIQPAEFAKLALIVYLASWMDKRESEISTFQNGLVPFAGIMLPVVFLLAIQPDFGSLAVVLVISVAIFFAAGANIFHLIFGSSMAVVMAIPIFLSSSHVRERFTAFLNPEQDVLGIGYQVMNSLIAIGSGGLFGRGFSKGTQKFGYLPEVQSDTIFSAIAEEMGFLRMSIFFLAFGYIAYQGYLIAEQTNDRFGKLLAVGITSWVVFQTLINVAVNLAIMPNTGITLPFISHGGSSLMALFAGVGILINIAKGTSNTYSHEYLSKRRRIGRSRFPFARRRHVV